MDCGCHNSDSERYTVKKPAYVILVFKHAIHKPWAIVYKYKVTILYSNKSLDMDSTISQQLIDDATIKFANILKRHGHVSSYWTNLETLGEPLIVLDCPNQQHSPRVRVPRKLKPKPTKSNTINLTNERQHNIASVQSLMKQLADTKSQLAIVRGIATSSKKAVTELSKTVNAALARGQQSSLTTTDTTVIPTPTKKHKKRSSQKEIIPVTIFFINIILHGLAISGKDKEA